MAVPAFTFDVDQPALKRQVGRFTVTLNHRLAGVTAGAVYRLAARIRDSMREEFIAGTDKDGSSHNKTGKTLSTWRISYGGMKATITMRGGSYYVEYRQPPHWIEASNGSALHWSDAGGDHFYARVFHPGYGGDKFVERGIRRGMAERDLFDSILHRASASHVNQNDWQGPTMSEAGIDPYQM